MRSSGPTPDQLNQKQCIEPSNMCFTGDFDVFSNLRVNGLEHRFQRQTAQFLVTRFSMISSLTSNTDFLRPELCYLQNVSDRNSSSLMRLSRTLKVYIKQTSGNQCIFWEYQIQISILLSMRSELIIISRYIIIITKVFFMILTVQSITEISYYYYCCCQQYCY